MGPVTTHAKSMTRKPRSGRCARGTRGGARRRPLANGVLAALAEARGGPGGGERRGGEAREGSAVDHLAAEARFLRGREEGARGELLVAEQIGGVHERGEQQAAAEGRLVQFGLALARHEGRHGVDDLVDLGLGALAEREQMGGIPRLPVALAHEAGRGALLGHPRGQRFHRGRAERSAADDHGHEAVAAREDEAPPEAGGPRVDAVAPRRPPVKGRERALAEHRPEHRHLGGDVDPLALSGHFALEVRDQRAHDRLPGRLQRCLVAADAHGRPVGVADQVHHPGHRLHHDLRPLPRAIRAVLAEGRDRGQDGARILAMERVPAQPALLEIAGRERFDHDVRATSHLEGASLAVSRVEVEDEAPRPARVGPPRQAGFRRAPRRRRARRGGGVRSRPAARRARRRRRGRRGSCRRGLRGRR